MRLTGRAGAAPLGPPDGLVPKLDRLAAQVTALSRSLGTEVALDPLEMLTARATIQGLGRQGRTSCGGASKLVSARDATICVSLARKDDVELVPAWLGIAAMTADPWDLVIEHAASRPADELVAWGAELGLPVSRLAERAPTPVDEAVRRDPHGPAEPASGLSGLQVVDLSSLWAGPLCGSLLAAAGAEVTKVESASRPDGGRLIPAFFELLNGMKSHRSIDFRASAGRAELRRVLSRADVVIEASRPRALAQLGIDPAEMMAEARPRVWVSITGHGRSGPDANRVGFGDDAAVAGGLVSWDDGEPVFCADAIADPLTGMAATAAALEAVSAGGKWLIDAALSRVASAFAGPTLSPAGP